MVKKAIVYNKKEGEKKGETEKRKRERERENKKVEEIQQQEGKI